MTLMSLHYTVLLLWPTVGKIWKPICTASSCLLNWFTAGKSGGLISDSGSQSDSRPTHIQGVEDRSTKTTHPPNLNTCNKNPGTEGGSSKEISSTHSSPADNPHEIPTLEEVTARQSTLLSDLQSADKQGGSNIDICSMRQVLRVWVVQVKFKHLLFIEPHAN